MIFSIHPFTIIQEQIGFLYVFIWLQVICNNEFGILWLKASSFIFVKFRIRWYHKTMKCLDMKNVSKKRFSHWFVSINRNSEKDIFGILVDFLKSILHVLKNSENNSEHIYLVKVPLGIDIVHFCGWCSFNHVFYFTNYYQ